MTHQNCIKCGRRATHRAAGNPAYVVCKAHADRWDVTLDVNARRNSNHGITTGVCLRAPCPDHV